MELKQTINKIKDELDSDYLNKQRKRYLQDYLHELEIYLTHHPEAILLPNSLELYCDSHPDAPECRVYNI